MAGPIAHPPPTSQRAFAEYIARATGLDIRVVLAWVLSEGGPADNPLNIGPGRHYGSPANAAKATVALLRTSRYRPILQSAGKPPAAQINAIAASPWDAGHYGGDGRNLRGAYVRASHGFPSTGTHSVGDTIGGVTGAVTGAAGSVGDALNPLSWIGQLEQWAAKEGALALLYLTFTALALAFLVLGGLRAFGQTPAIPFTRRTYTPPNMQDQGFPEGF